MQQAMSGITKVGWIGTGNMGYWMCYHCLKKGYDITVYNRTPSRCKPLEAYGAKVVNTPEEVAKNSDVVFTIVGLPSDVRQVIAGPQGVLSGLKSGGIIVDMTTSEPALATELQNEGTVKNIELIDAPVSGGETGAKNGTLTIMCGGNKHAYEFVSPIFNCMAKSYSLMGPAGMGQHTKATNQILVGAGLIGIVESLLYARKAGLDLEQVLQTLAPGAAGSWGLNTYAPKIINSDYKPGFIVNHFVKDMGIALNEAKNMNLCLPGLALVHQLYQAVQAQGYGAECVNALYKALEKINNMEQ